MTAAVTCRTCGGEPRAGARFCDACGAPIESAQPSAEYKQVTVLFADVVRSMDIASQLDTERLRELMAEVFERSAAVVRRYGGTVSQFTGDGIMAVFGAPVTLEDHAFRACMAALDVQGEMDRLSDEVNRRDGIALQLRVGLNSGQVIAGEIGSGSAGYTTIGQQVGMAQRMESVAPPGGVMLTESTARLVEDTAVLGESELMHIKGSDDPVPTRRLLAVDAHQHRRRSESRLVGREWEINTLTGILGEAISGAGCVVNIVGPPGIGKSRLVRETADIAAGRGVSVFGTYCESHTNDIPFHAIARLLRAAMEIDEHEDDAARVLAHSQFPDASPEDLLLLDDLLGIRDSTVPQPEIAPDARRRRLTALVNSASLARQEPSVYVIEDAHWIDDASESMLADFLSVIPQIPALVLITYRPEYHGVLSRVPDSQTVALRPLNDAQSSMLTAQLLGADPSLGELAAQVADRAAGNPFFVEEMVRDLAEQGVLHGDPGAYRLGGDVADASVPATLQAAIGARIDRLGSTAKRTVNAAAVIGSRFDGEGLGVLVEAVDVTPLIEAQLIEQVKFTPRAEYAFRHPLIRKVAYESQLKSDRAQLHRRLAEAIEEAGAVDENAALVAEHLEAAGDLHGAFDWHMRAGTWVIFRDMAAAQTSWRRARQVADRLPDNDNDRMSMRIAPRSLLSASAFRTAGSGAETGFDELRDLCIAVGDQRSLAIGMAGLVIAHTMRANRRESSRLADELVRLLESIGDPTLTVALLGMALIAKHETAEMAELLALAQRLIDLADGDAAKGNLITDSPLSIATALRGIARCCLGAEGWRDDLQNAMAMAPSFEATTFVGVIYWVYSITISNGVLIADGTALRDTAEALAIAGKSGDDLALDLARAVRGVALAHQSGDASDAALQLLAEVRERALAEQFSLTMVPLVDTCAAKEMARRGDVDGAIELSRNVVDGIESGPCIWTAVCVAALVEFLIRRGSDADVREARAAIDRLAAIPTDPGFVLKQIWVLRIEALLARARGDDGPYRDFRDRYRKMASELGFEGHMAWAEAMD
jgi:adenylate cyclase